MRLVSFVTTADGGSRFIEVAAPLALEHQDGLGHTLRLSAPYVSPAVQFVELPAGMDQDWHNAPARQLVVVLSGEVEVETSDGATRRWRAGECFVPADVSGRGHRTRSIGGAVRVLFVPLAADFEFSPNV